MSNVVFVMADTLHRHPMGCCGDRAAHMANLDRLATEGLRFDRSSASSWTTS